jgi:hypothetical protein
VPQFCGEDGNSAMNNEEDVDLHQGRLGQLSSAAAIAALHDLVFVNYLKQSIVNLL